METVTNILSGVDEIILKRAAGNGLPREIGSADKDLRTYADLIDAGYLDGCVLVNAGGQPYKVRRPRITESGKEYVLEFCEDNAPQPLFLKNATIMVLKVLALALPLIIVGFSQRSEKDHDVSLPVGEKNSSAQLTSIDTSQTQQTVSNTRWNIGVCGISPIE